MYLLFDKYRYAGVAYVSVGAVGAAAPTLFSEGLFRTHRNSSKRMNIKEFHRKLMDFEFLHPQLSIPDMHYVIMYLQGRC